MRGLDADDLALMFILLFGFLCMRTCLQLGGLVGMLLIVYIYQI